MDTMQDIRDFVSQKKLAIVGLSRQAGSFSRMAFQELSQKGYRLIPVNPNADSIAGEKCYPTIAALPEKVDGVLVFTKPAQTESIVRQALAAGIRRVWMQRGADSPAALEFCRANGLPAVSRQCILMFAEPVAAFHAFHRAIKRFFGGLPR